MTALGPHGDSAGIEFIWVAVRDFNVSSYTGETILTTTYIYIYIHPFWVFSMKFLNSNQRVYGAVLGFFGKGRAWIG